MREEAYRKFLKGHNKILSKLQASRYLGVSKDTITRYIRNGVLQSTEVDGMEMVFIDEVKTFTDLVNAEEAGEILGVSSRTILRRMERGSIPFIYYHKKKCCQIKDLIRYAESHRRD